jgi:N-acylglucosamine-6-phosphate 2-epimerase
MKSLEERRANVLARWRGGLIVSCQAAAGSPLARPEIIAALALTAELNGAVGVRIDGPANVAAVRRVISIPILGIEKVIYGGFDVYITPTFAAAARVVRSGADLVALDGTLRPRPQGETLPKIIRRVREELQTPVVADVATEAEGLAAGEEYGADFISTTLSGYTAETRDKSGPDFELVERLSKRLAHAPVICEGRVRDPEDVRRAFDCGAFAVCVGTAITGVDWLVRQYVAATPVAKERREAAIAERAADPNGE